MPKIRAELTAERAEEATRRVARSRAAVAERAAARPAHQVRDYPSAAAATAAASRASAHLAETTAERLPSGRWVPVVLLRSDQGWMRSSVEERGALARMAE